MSLLLDTYDYDINTVTWGYRDKFRSIIERLINEGFIGSKKDRNTKFFFDFLQKHSGTPFDDIAHNFLLAPSHP